MIQKALLKYGNSSIQRDIIEYFYPAIIIENKQYYFNHFKPEYIYIIKTDIYLIGFIHSEDIIYLIGATKLGRKRPEAAK